jgi:hypothetical protein
MDDPLFVISDTYEGARLYARENDLGREGQDWRYLTEPHQVLGRRNGRYAVYTWGTCPDWERRRQLLECLRMSEFEEQ